MPQAVIDDGVNGATTNFSAWLQCSEKLGQRNSTRLFSRQLTGGLVA
jgi:hypothetical protein